MISSLKCLWHGITCWYWPKFVTFFFTACGVPFDITTLGNCYVYTGRKEECSLSGQPVQFFETYYNTQQVGIPLTNDIDCNGTIVFSTIGSLLFFVFLWSFILVRFASAIHGTRFNYTLTTLSGYQINI